MNLIEIRTMFRDISGRYDLVNADLSDNGADIYIQQGQKSLERRTNYTPSTATVFKDITAGSYLIQLKSCRVISDVWIISTDGRKKLKKFSMEDLRSFNYLPPLSSPSGAPSLYYPANLRRSPDDEDGLSDSATLKTFIDTISPSNPTITGLVIYPPADIDYGLEIHGLFYNLQLTNDTDSNYWTVNYPMILLMASLQQLGNMYRGAKSSIVWDDLIEKELTNIDKDHVEQEIASVNIMEG